jgi:hypothetical protein
LSKKNEVSPGGSEMLRHQARERGYSPPPDSTGEPEIVAHFSRYFGEPESVFHEIVSDLVHIDVHIIKPHAGRGCWTLFTTGMSDRPMTTPEGAEDFRFAELILNLPAEWRVDALRATPPPPDLERWYWPIYWLKKLARLPHEYQTWLGSHHTIPNGDPAKPFHPGTRLCSWLIIPPISVPEEARVVELANGRKIQLYTLHALYLEELSLKLNEGGNALLDAFERDDVSEILYVDRKPVVRKKRFGLF